MVPGAPEERALRRHDEKRPWRPKGAEKRALRTPTWGGWTSPMCMRALLTNGRRTTELRTSAS
eukprot:15293421-Alexandrium_andersonii.AAC.1